MIVLLFLAADALSRSDHLQWFLRVFEVAKSSEVRTLLLQLLTELVKHGGNPVKMNLLALKAFGYVTGERNTSHTSALLHSAQYQLSFQNR